MKKLLKTIFPYKIRQDIRFLPRYFAFAGARHFCPVCGWSFRRFKDFGHPVRENTLCPRCNSLERHRLMWLFFKNRTDIFKAPLKMLHVAPEDCLFEHFIDQKNLDYLTGDLLDKFVMKKMDITDTGLAKNTFDVVICNHVLEHIPDDRKAMQEIYRILKPGGWAMLQTPIDRSRDKTHEDASITSEEDRLKHFGQKDHVRIYGKDLYERLKECGFNVTADEFVTTLDEHLIEKCRLNVRERICIARK